MRGRRLAVADLILWEAAEGYSCGCWRSCGRQPRGLPAGGHLPAQPRLQHQPTTRKKAPTDHQQEPWKIDWGGPSWRRTSRPSRGNGQVGVVADIDGGVGEPC